MDGFDGVARHEGLPAARAQLTEASPDHLPARLWWLLGALTLGSEIRSADVEKFSLRNGCPILVLANGEVVASTVSAPDPSIIPSDRRQFALRWDQRLSNAA